MTPIRPPEEGRMSDLMGISGFDLWRTLWTVHWSHECSALKRARWGRWNWNWATDKTRAEIEACFTRLRDPLRQCRRCWPKEMLVTPPPDQERRAE